MAARQDAHGAERRHRNSLARRAVKVLALGGKLFYPIGVMLDTPSKDSQIIDALGGSCAVAALCNVTSQAVSQWRRSGIPEARRMYLQLLRPDAFPAAQEVAKG